MKTTGICAANYTESDLFDAEHCGPVRKTEEEARRDMKADGYEGVRYIGEDGYLYVDRQYDE